MRKTVFILGGLVAIVLIGVLVFNRGDNVNSYAVANIKSCSDTDNGVVYEIKGTVSWRNTAGDGVKEDYCMNNGVLIEYKCIGNEMDSEQKRCDMYCLEGACTAP